MPQRDWFSQYEATPARAPAPAAPPRDDWFSQYEAPSDGPTFRTSNERDPVTVAPVVSLDAQPARRPGVPGLSEAFSAGTPGAELAAGWWETVSPIPLIKAVSEMTSDDYQRAKASAQRGDYTGAVLHTLSAHPVTTMGKLLTNIGKAHWDQVEKAYQAVTSGRPAEGMGRVLAATLPLVGPMAAEIGERATEDSGARTVGRTLGLLTPLGVPKKAGAQVLKPRVPVNPADASAVNFALAEGVPLDVATATGSRVARNLQKRAGDSLGGSGVVARAQQAQGEALGYVGNRLAEEANIRQPGIPSRAVGPIQAGEGVTAARTGEIKAQAGKADTAYTRLRQMEEGAPSDVVPARAPVAPDVPPEQAFMVRWLADDLTEMGFQQGGSTAAQRRAAYENWRPGDPEYLKSGFVPSGRVAGTPVYDTLRAMGVSGTRGEMALKLEKFLQGRTKDPRIAAYADAMKEALGGDGFNWDQVSDATISRMGIKRHQLRSPQTLPDFESYGAGLFFPDEAGKTLMLKEGAPTQSMQLAVDLRPQRAALKPIHDALTAERDVAGVLMGGKARAAVALKALMEGPDFAPLSVVDAALSDLKAIARGAEMPELRTAGQGVAAQAVSQLDAAVRARAAAAGPKVLQALEEGRAATKAKYDVAEALDFAETAKEPGQVFNAVTAPKDAGIKKLREVKRLTPEVIPDIGRALLEDILEAPTDKGGFKGADTARTRWFKVGGETRRILFPKAGQASALDDFFNLAQKIGENPNPSGTAGAITATNLTVGGLPMYALARVLYSPKAAQLATRGLRLSMSPATSARALAAAQFAAALREAGVNQEEK